MPEIMKIKVNDACKGCGTCESICEEVFQVVNGRARVKEELDIPCVDEAIEFCPEGAISKED